MTNAITTNKTDFFREAHHFAFLRSEISAPLVAKAAAGGSRSLRIWSAGCSSGEEPYSIALTVLDNLPGASSWDVKILASDIDTDMLAKAQEGVYPMERIANVPPQVLERYFLRGKGARAGLVRVRREVMDLVTLRWINLQDPAWPIRTLFDCIFCRNVMIYFDKRLQRQLIARFADLLKPGGHLFLGHSESLIGMGVGLTYLGNTVYQKVDDGVNTAMGQEVRRG
jgi:chemotaxis protein methyltransferase CheR